MRRSISLVGALFFVINMITVSNSQSVSTNGLGGGITQATGDGSEYWNTGFNISGEWFQYISDNFQTGARFAFNRLGANEQALKDEFAYYDIDMDVSGSANIFEIVPSLRAISSPGKKKQLQLFAQMGAGLYILNMQAEATATYMGNSATESSDETETKFGINFGAGIIVGNPENTRFSIYPMYSVIFTEGESTKFFSYNVALIF